LHARAAKLPAAENRARHLDTPNKKPPYRRLFYVYVYFYGKKQPDQIA
jgi:hypothetical protein